MRSLLYGDLASGIPQLGPLGAIKVAVGTVLAGMGYPAARIRTAYLNDALFNQIQYAAYREARRRAYSGLVTVGAVGRELHDRNYYRLSEKLTAAGWTAVPPALIR